MWSGMEKRARTRMAWSDCCRKKFNVVLALVDPKVAKNILMCKWIIYAMDMMFTNGLGFIA